MFKPGDKVRITNKAFPSFHGKYGIIKGKTLEGHYSVKLDWGFGDFLFLLKPDELTKQEDKMKKEITLENLWPHLCYEWKDQLVRDFGQYGMASVIPEDMALNYEKKVGQEGWLAKNGFVKEKKSYKVGQRFKWNEYTFILAQTQARTVQAICTDDGNRMHDCPVQVMDVTRITESEIEKIIRNNEVKWLD